MLAIVISETQNAFIHTISFNSSGIAGGSNIALGRGPNRGIHGPGECAGRVQTQGPRHHGRAVRRRRRKRSDGAGDGSRISAVRPGVQVSVENRPGGNGVLGYNYLKQAKGNPLFSSRRRPPLSRFRS